MQQYSTSSNTNNILTRRGRRAGAGRSKPFPNLFIELVFERLEGLRSDSAPAWVEERRLLDGLLGATSGRREVVLEERPVVSVDYVLRYCGSSWRRERSSWVLPVQAIESGSVVVFSDVVIGIVDLGPWSAQDRPARHGLKARLEEFQLALVRRTHFDSLFHELIRNNI